MNVYVIEGGWNYEGDTVIGVAASLATAKRLATEAATRDDRKPGPITRLAKRLKSDPVVWIVADPADFDYVSITRTPVTP